MGIGIASLLELDRAGVFGRGDIDVLDIGASNIYGASAAELTDFLGKYGTRPLDAALRATAADLAERSDPTHPRALTFAGELFAETTIRYRALDIFPGPYTRIFDLNRESVPRALRGRFDVILNFGTTEHVFGQFNAFKVIHDALKPGGYAFHQLPALGFFNHGYFAYHPRVFAELAKANGYTVADLFYSDAGGTLLDKWLVPFPNAGDPARYQASIKAIGGDTALHRNGLINALLRKERHAPFRVHLETVSTLGEVDPRIAGGYGRGPAFSPLRTALRKLGVGRALRKLGLR